MASLLLRVTLGFVLVILLLQNESFASGPGLQLPEEKPLFEDVIIRNPSARYILPHDYRLPRNLVPEHYIIHIRPILDVGDNPGDVNTAPGKVEMHVRCVEDTETVTFNSKDVAINFTSVKVENLADGTVHVVESHSADVGLQIVELKLNSGEGLIAGSNYSISLDFVAQIPESLLGMYYRTYLTPEGETKKVVLTKLEAVGARMIFPCFDEPALKATYQINIAHTAKYNTLCNMLIVDTIDDPELPGWTWDVYDTTVKMSTYLIAIVVSEFTEVKAPVDSFERPVSTWAAPHHIRVGGGNFSASETAHMLKHFTDVYGVRYPLTKMYSAAIPQFSSGAMEQWGLITYRDDYLLYFPGVSTELNRFTVSRIIAHEVAHQWFGNIVTMEWWDNLWLNEGFASYVEEIGVQSSHPEFETRPVSTARINALVTDVRPDTKPVHYNGDNLSGIVYDKANFLIRMMSAFLTYPTFQKGVNQYLQNHLFGNAKQDDLFTELTRAGHADGTLNPSLTVKDIMDTWTRQTGFPLIRVGRIAANRIYISQERFGTVLPMFSGDVLNPTELWNVPLSFASTKSPGFDAPNQRPKLWLHKASRFQSFTYETDEGDWLVANVDATAFYRVLYDDHFTQALKKTLDTNHAVISPATRSQIIDDHFKSAFANYIPIRTALDFTTYLNKEDTWIVWQTFITNFRPSFTMLRGHSTHVEELREYLSGKLDGALGLFGVKQLPEDRGQKVIGRAALLDWACTLGVPACTAYATELFEEWKAAAPGTNPVPVDIRPVIYCAMVWQNGREAYNFFLNLYETTSPTVWPNHVKPLYGNALACASQEELIDELLATLVKSDSVITVENAIQVFARLAASSEGRPKLAAFISTNVGQIVARLGLLSVPPIIDAMAAHWSEKDKLDYLKSLITAWSTISAYEPIIARLHASIILVENNYAWMQSNGNAIGHWLVEENDKNTPDPTTMEPPTPTCPAVSCPAPVTCPEPEPVTCPTPQPTPSTTPSSALKIVAAVPILIIGTLFSSVMF